MKEIKNLKYLFCSFALYGSQRFIFEFFRDNNKVIVFRRLYTANGNLGISNLALWALAMFVEGVIFIAVFYYIDKKRKNQIQEKTAVN